jgi:hypothetical protein
MSLENKCLQCECPVKNKYCNVSCQNKHQNYLKAKKKYGELKRFKVQCHCCKGEIEVEEREKQHPKKEKYFCSRSCANTRKRTEKSKEKTSKSLKGWYKENKPANLPVNIKCEQCSSKFTVNYNKRNQRFCSRSCAAVWANKNTDKARLGGLASAQTQSERMRSKNEIHFANFCQKEFETVLTNEPIFNGWDADVIIEDYKIAVLWNGVWHYKKITEQHSVKQVQNRDRIKIKEIEKAGYIPYVIKDMGSEDETFVKQKFQELISFLGI